MGNIGRKILPDLGIPDNILMLFSDVGNDRFQLRIGAVPAFLVNLFRQDFNGSQ